MRTPIYHPNIFSGNGHICVSYLNDWKNTNDIIGIVNSIFDLFNKFTTPVVIIGENKETVFTNNTFKRIFRDFDNIKKFSHRLYFCAKVYKNHEKTHKSFVI